MKSAGKARGPAVKRVRSPVIAGRVPESVHQRIKEAAGQSGRSMSEELAFRAGLAFEWEKRFSDAAKLLDEGRRLKTVSFNEHARQEGFEIIHGLAGDYYKKPGTPPLQVSLAPEFRAAIADIVRDAVKQALVEVNRAHREALIQLAETLSAGSPGSNRGGNQ